MTAIRLAARQQVRKDAIVLAACAAHHVELA
jgi:hypothetical protein